MSRRETYAAARSRLLAALAAAGWRTAPHLKMPWADDGAVRLWFTSQAVHLGPSGAPHGAARSLFLDTRGMPVDAFLDAVKVWR